MKDCVLFARFSPPLDLKVYYVYLKGARVRPGTRNWMLVSSRLKRGQVINAPGGPARITATRRVT
jgi:hypothetical protein